MRDAEDWSELDETGEVIKDPINPYEWLDNAPTLSLIIPLDAREAMKIQHQVELMGDSGIAQFFHAAFVSSLVSKKPELLDVLSKSYAKNEDESIVTDTAGNKTPILRIKLEFFEAAGEVICQLPDGKGGVLEGEALITEVINAGRNLMTRCFGNHRKMAWLPVPDLQ